MSCIQVASAYTVSYYCLSIAVISYYMCQCATWERYIFVTAATSMHPSEASELCS